MAFFEWDDSIALGIPTIDQQHKAIFDWINTLNEAIKSGDISDAVGEVIWGLISYVTTDAVMQLSKPGSSPYRA